MEKGVYRAEEYAGCPQWDPSQKVRVCVRVGIPEWLRAFRGGKASDAAVGKLSLLALKLLTRGSKPTSPAYSPSRLMGRLRKGTASEKSPCILRELTAAAQDTKEAHGQPLKSRRLVS
jgi:hypothetical protein